MKKGKILWDSKEKGLIKCRTLGKRNTENPPAATKTEEKKKRPVRKKTSVKGYIDLRRGNAHARGWK